VYVLFNVFFPCKTQAYTVTFLYTPTIGLHIIWSSRLVQAGSNSYSAMIVDGIDFKINEPYPFNPMWFSHKFKSAGVRYEVAFSINGGDIVHIYGPVPCGACPDITNFWVCLMHKLLHGEMVEADNRY
jgi:hypothetical protein